MYDDPIPYVSSQYHHPGQRYSPHEDSTTPEPDLELSRLHQHQLLIQLRLEVNSLRTQIQQLELLKQQLLHQRQMMAPLEFEQLMDQFARTTASLLRVGHPSHFSQGSCQQIGSQGVVGVGGFRGGGGEGPGAGAESYVGMHVMERLQEKLRNMTFQQHQQRLQQQQHEHQRPQDMETDIMMTRHQGSISGSSSGCNSPRRDPVRIEQISLEADLRDLEKRMRSIQLLR